MAGPTPASSMFTPRRRVVGKWQRRTIMRFVAKIGLAYYPGQRHGELLLEQLRESLCGGGFDLYFWGCVLVHMGKDFWQRFEDESVSMFSFFYFLLSASVGQSGGPFLGEGIPVPIWSLVGWGVFLTFSIGYYHRKLFFRREVEKRDFISSLKRTWNSQGCNRNKDREYVTYPKGQSQPFN